MEWDIYELQAHVTQVVYEQLSFAQTPADLSFLSPAPLCLGARKQGVYSEILLNGTPV